jgi:hypothetical protein
LSLALASFLAVAISGGKAGAADIWHPTGQMQWQWVLQTPVDTSVKVPVFDIDGFDNNASVVTTLHANGARVICYISAGSYENWRPDASSFPSSVLGSSNGWPGEQWLDIRQISILGPIMLARMQMCASKGFDAIEPDNVDGYSNQTGFPLTAKDQLQYNIWLATTAHSLGLSIGLKNDTDHASSLQPYFDWMLDEQCFQYSECSSLTPFISAGKTVFETEYQGTPSSICPQANSMGLSTIFKSVNLLNKPLTECVTASASQAPVITSPLTSSGTVGAAYSYQITATNGPTSFSDTGLPTGITVNTATGLISGTPLSAGSFSVTLTAANGGGTGTATLVLQVSSLLLPLGIITASPLPSGVVGVAYSQAIVVTGGTAPYTWSIVAGTLPSGLLLNSATGVISVPRQRRQPYIHSPSEG